VSFRLSRRSFLVAAGLGAASAPILWRSPLDLLRAAPEIFVSARDDSAGNHFISGVNADGTKRFSISVDLRCHGVAVHPRDPYRAIVFARRPGTLAYEVDFFEGEVLRQISSPQGRHFYGHGSYSNDGRYLFCSENDYAQARGVVAIYDARGLKRLGEVSSFGIGPHELQMLPDGKTLVIANGGIITHPDNEREKLNLATMSPSLVYLDLDSGKPVGEFKLNEHQLSIRHLAQGADGTVGIAMQFEGDKHRHPPLIAFHQGESEIRLAKVPSAISAQMNNYALSICIEPTTGVACVSSPRGNLLTFWDSKSTRFLSMIRVRDPGGVAIARNKPNFIVTTGAGAIYTISASTRLPERVVQSQDTRWDNHLGVQI